MATSPSSSAVSAAADVWTSRSGEPSNSRRFPPSEIRGSRVIVGSFRKRRSLSLSVPRPTGRSETKPSRMRTLATRCAMTTTRTPTTRPSLSTTTKTSFDLHSARRHRGQWGPLPVWTGAFTVAWPLARAPGEYDRSGVRAERWGSDADRRGLGPIVAVSGVDLLGERVQPHVLVGIGDLGRYESLFVAELAFGVRLQVVVPLRMFRSSRVEAIRIGSGPSWK